jgi:hypothetical protein
MVIVPEERGFKITFDEIEGIEPAVSTSDRGLRAPAVPGDGLE